MRRVLVSVLYLLVVLTSPLVLFGHISELMLAEAGTTGRPNWDIFLKSFRNTHVVSKRCRIDSEVGNQLSLVNVATR